MSCSVEKKIAREFIESKVNYSFLLLPPDCIYKSNTKVDEIVNADSIDKWDIDSLLLINNLFLQYVSDSIFLENYINGIINELLAYGFDIYFQNSLDTFLFIQNQAYIINIAQIELDEYIMPVNESEIFNDSILYYKNFGLNAVSISSWFEITKLNPKKEGRKVFYISDYVSDCLEGLFVENIFTGEVKYKYSFIEMELEDIYDLSSVLGKKYAGYIFDYLLNEHINRQLPQNTIPRYYFHYNRSNNTIRPASKDRFIFYE